MKRIFTLAVAACAAMLFGIEIDAAQAQQTSRTNLAYCINQDYALCAASTCKPTNRRIAVDTPEGGKRFFQEAECTCPVLPSGATGALANLGGGNMRGSCASPPGTVWSLYKVVPNIPQAAYGWDSVAAGVNLTCTADLNLGRKFANCFSFRCDNIRTVKNSNDQDVKVATCHCPLGEDVFSALPTRPATAFYTQAGGSESNPQAKQAFCYQYPVGGF